MLDPRGARPVEQGTRSDKCATEKEWPFCTDDQWVMLVVLTDALNKPFCELVNEGKASDAKPADITIII